MSDDRVVDMYPCITDFEDILEDARMSACNDKEEEFVKSTKDKYQQWGGRMFWSVKQDQWLRSIAGDDE